MIASSLRRIPGTLVIRLLDILLAGSGAITRSTWTSMDDVSGDAHRMQLDDNEPHRMQPDDIKTIS
ncbi:hypothetical protein ACRQD2_05075 [Actinotignum sp. GS-2025e]